MSRALSRLRAHFDDQLFVRTGGKLVATPLGEALAEPILRALETLRRGLLLGQRFDPSIAARTFKIAMVGYCEALLLPPLFAQVQRQAPGIGFRSVPAVPDEGETLRSGDLDLAITSRPLRGALVTQRLLTDPFVVALRRNHPAVREGHLTLGSYLSLGFVAIDDLPVDTGCARPPAVRVHSFLGAAALLVATDLVAVLPEQMASRLAQQLPICIVPPPLDLVEFELKVSWPERLRDEPAHRWLRRRLRDVAESICQAPKHIADSTPALHPAARA